MAGDDKKENLQNSLDEALNSSGIKGYDADAIAFAYNRRAYVFQEDDRVDFLSAVLIDILQMKRYGIVIDTEAINKSIDRVYHDIIRDAQRRRRHITASLSEAVPETEAVAKGSVQEELDYRELEDAIRGLVRSLKGEDAMILALKFFGESDKSIQMKLNMARSTYYRKWQHIRDQLAREIGETR